MKTHLEKWDNPKKRNKRGKPACGTKSGYISGYTHLINCLTCQKIIKVIK
jgi:hypothetical protein